MHGANRYGLQCLKNLDQLPPQGAMIPAAPLKIEGGSGSLARAGAGGAGMSAPTETQVVFVGSGINSLVGAALGRARQARAGAGTQRPARRLHPHRGTVPRLPARGVLVLASASAVRYAELKSELEQAGLEVLCGDYSTGLVGPDGRGLALRQDMADAARRLDALSPGDGQALQDMAARMFGEDAALTFGLLGKNPYSWDLLKLLYSEWRKRGLDGMTASPPARWRISAAGPSARCARTRRALIAPWTLHSGLGPDDAGSALIGKLTFAAVVSGGMLRDQGAAAAGWSRRWPASSRIAAASC